MPARACHRTVAINLGWKNLIFAFEGEFAKSHLVIATKKKRRIEIVKEISIKMKRIRLDFPQHETLCIKVDIKPKRRIS